MADDRWFKFLFVSTGNPVSIRASSIDAVNHLDGSKGEHSWSRLTVHGVQIDVIGEAGQILAAITDTKPVSFEPWPDRSER